MDPISLEVWPLVSCDVLELEQLSFRRTFLVCLRVFAMRWLSGRILATRASPV